MSRHQVQIVRRGRPVSVELIGPTETLLDYLREREGAVGTKEGCREGDCGACTVAVGRLKGDTIEFQPINACITFLGMVDGAEIVTVDDLAPGVEQSMGLDKSQAAVAPQLGHLHPVQAAMAQAHASQCGFCTPGFVMSLFCLYHAGVAADRPTVNRWLAGNLCRCTGYRPIVQAAMTSCDGRPDDRFSRTAASRLQEIKSLDLCKGLSLYAGDEASFFAAPQTLNELLTLYTQHPDATLVAGATDVGLWVTKSMGALPKVIHLSQVRELNFIDDQRERLVVGAAVTYERAESALAALDPDVDELLRRLGAKQVRASGTLGGNVANGSPIGDSPPLLIALGCELELASASGRRRLPLEDFFVTYGKQDLLAGEVVTALSIPKLKANERFRCYKLSKRVEQDISAVMGAFKFELDQERITSARVAFGGMAATPKRATQTEAALVGVSLRDPSSWADALATLSSDFQPIDDLRASANYRSQAAQALLRKAIVECADTDAGTRLFGSRARH